MAWLLDTHVVSEATSRSPDRRGIAWCDAHADVCHISALTLGEIWKGIEGMPAGKRRNAPKKWAETLEAEALFPPLSVDAETGRIWGKLHAKHKAQGFNMDVFDSLLAATALQHGLTVVTRNTKDFPPEVPTLNPWLS